MGIEIRPWEVAALVALDDARRGVWSEAEGKGAKKHPALRKVVPATNAKAVEALFDGFGKRAG